MKTRDPKQGREIRPGLREPRVPLYVPRPRERERKEKRKKQFGIMTLKISLVVLMVLFVVLLGLALIPVNERPTSGIFYNIGNTLGVAMNQPTSSDYIQEQDIEIYNDKIIINVAGAVMSRYAPTGSMLPGINHTANGIEIPITDVNQIYVGDIIAFQPKKDSNELIVHRVIEIGYDSEGWYCITKGDNNPVDDGKIREWQVKFKTIMIIY